MSSARCSLPMKYVLAITMCHLSRISLPSTLPWLAHSDKSLSSTPVHPLSTSDNYDYKPTVVTDFLVADGAVCTYLFIVSHKLMEDDPVLSVHADERSQPRDTKGELILQWAVFSVGLVAIILLFDGYGSCLYSSFS